MRNKSILSYLFFTLILVLPTFSQTDMLYNKGDISVKNNTVLFVKGNVINETGAKISIDGTIQLTADFKNNGNGLTNQLNTPATIGTFLFQGSSSQNILGGTSTTFEKLSINNGNSVNLLTQNENINSELNFQSGNIILNTYNLSLAGEHSCHRRFTVAPSVDRLD